MNDNESGNEQAGLVPNVSLQNLAHLKAITGRDDLVAPIREDLEALQKMAIQHGEAVVDAANMQALLGQAREELAAANLTIENLRRGLGTARESKDLPKAEEEPKGKK